MKSIKIFLTALVAGTALLFGCNPEPITGYDLSSLKVDKSYVQIDTLGGSATITLTAKEAWKLYVKTSYEWSEKPTSGPDSGKTLKHTVDTLITPGTTCKPHGIKDAVESWITADPTEGEAGSVQITISAPANDSYRTQDVRIIGESKASIVLKVAQGEDVTKEYTTSEALAVIRAGKQTGSPVIVKGIVCKINEISTSYGNATYFISDDGTYTGDNATGNWLEVYRGLWLNGAAFTKGDELAVGDEVTIKAVLIDYKGTPETSEKTAEVLSIKKSLISVDCDKFEVKKGDTTVVAKVVYSGDGLEFEADSSWLSVAGMTKVADTTLVSIHVSANVNDTRSGSITFTSSKGKSTSQVTVTVTQASGLLAYSLPYSETFLSGIGAWTAEDVTAVEGVSSIWNAAGNYGMKATSTKKVVSEAELVSPLIDLSAAESPVLTFEHVQRYAGDVYSELTLYASADNGATWTELQIPNYSDGSNWTFVPSGNISLARFKGALACIKFVYKSNANAYATWEIKNLKVEDVDFAPTNIAELNNSAADTEAEWSGTLTDAVVAYVSGGNAFIQDATGGIQLYKSGHGLTVGQKINGAVSGKIKMYHGFAELTAFTAGDGVLADGEAPAPTVVTLDNLLGGYLHWTNQLIKLENVKLTTALILDNDNRDTKVQQGESEINAYSQAKGKINIPAETAGDLVCIPTRYNATLQVGIWETAHFTAKE